MQKAAIVGCGNIAGFLDTPDEKNILTHAHAYEEYKGTELVAVCDPDIQQRNSFIKKWGDSISQYDSFERLLSQHTIDIVSICSPTAFHYEAMLLALKDKNIKTIICEKPFVQTQDQYNALRPLLKETKKKVIINFMRRFDPSLQKVQKMIKHKELGEILSFNGKFTKGLYHNGSHMLELIEHLCGEIQTLQSMDFTEVDNDFYGNFHLKTDSCRGIIQNFSGKNYALFELEIILSKGRILIKDSGHTIHIETPQPSKEYAGYYNLQKSSTLDETMNLNLYHTLEFAINPNLTVFDKHLSLSKKLLDINSMTPKKLSWKDT